MDARTKAEAGQNYKNLFCVILYTKPTKGVILPSVGINFSADGKWATSLWRGSNQIKLICLCKGGSYEYIRKTFS